MYVWVIKSIVCDILACVYALFLEKFWKDVENVVFPKSLFIDSCGTLYVDFCAKIFLRLTGRTVIDRANMEKPSVDKHLTEWM
jgi:hypothetical protein